MKFGDGLIVHDDCAAARSAWMHGVDERTVAKDIAAVARAFSCRSEDNQISMGVQGIDWLWSAVASVANASAEAARRSVGKARKEAARELEADDDEAKFNEKLGKLVKQKPKDEEKTD